MQAEMFSEAKRNRKQTRNIMKNQMKLAAVAAITALSFMGMQSVSAQAGETVIKGLLSQPLPDIDGKVAKIVLFDVAPDWTIANHFHPGHIFIYMLEGTITISAEGQEPRTLGVGDVVYEIPDVNMVAGNVSSTEGAKFVVFVVGNVGDDVTVFVD